MRSASVRAAQSEAHVVWPSLIVPYKCASALWRQCAEDRTALTSFEGRPKSSGLHAGRSVIMPAAVCGARMLVGRDGNSGDRAA